MSQRPITALLIGAGASGVLSYAPYALQNPNELRFVAVAEPRDFLRESFAKTHELPPEAVFSSYEDALRGGPVADCVLICTQDNMHVAPALMALEAGYRFLMLEKPISSDMDECALLAQKAAACGAKVMVCHSLRYTSFYRKMRQLIADKVIGDLCAIRHIEGVGYYHQAHSFVRGDWGNVEKSSPMILAKCCHDMDLLVYLSGRRCESISSFGSLVHFTRENAPKGSPDRCIDGCPVAGTCPYNALRIYGEKIGGFYQHAVEKEGFSDLVTAMREGRYGRCVYKCDNTAVDRQVVSLLMEGGVTATHTMTAFTRFCDRETCVHGTLGELKGELEAGRIVHYDYASGDTVQYTIPGGFSGHSGADTIMMRELVQMVRTGAASVSDVSVSVESHLMCMAAEKARLTKTVVSL